MSDSKLTILTVTMILLTATSTLAQQDGGANQKFGPIAVHGNSVVFDPDNVLTHSQLAKLGANGKLGAKPAVLALTFTAGAQQTFIFSASGKIGCCGTINIGPDGYARDSNIKLLKSISGFNAPAATPLVGVFTDGKPEGAAPPRYNYKKGLGQSAFSPRLNQVFFIGDGLTGTGKGKRQIFHVPATATELWFGIADAGGFNGKPGDYGDNPGKFSVSGVLHISE